MLLVQTGDVMQYCTPDSDQLTEHNGICTAVTQYMQRLATGNTQNALWRLAHRVGCLALYHLIVSAEESVDWVDTPSGQGNVTSELKM